MRTMLRGALIGVLVSGALLILAIAIVITLRWVAQSFGDLTAIILAVFGFSALVGAALGIEPKARK